MAQRTKLSLDYEAEIPAQPVSDQTFTIAARAYFHLVGSVDPGAAVQAFDPERSLEPRDLAHKIKENMRHWLRHAASQTLRERLALPGVDPLEMVTEPEKVRTMIRQTLEGVFRTWTFEVEELEVQFEITSSCMNTLPENLRQRLSSLEGELDTAAAFSFVHVFEEELDTVTDPVTGVEVRVYALARVAFTAHPEECQIALDPKGKMTERELGQALLNAVGPWYDYAVKQACYNALFEQGRTDPAVLKDHAAMRQRVGDLARDHVTAIGVLHADVQLNCEAMDTETARALHIPLRGMASTVVADDDEVVIPGTAPTEGGLRPVEEAVWRHQKAIVASQPKLSRKELARQILASLEKDGYSTEDRRRVGQWLGADPADLP